MKLLIRCLIGLAAVLVIGIAGIALWLTTVDINAYRTSIETAIEDATGREASISGPLQLQIGLPVAVGANDVALANASWGSRPEMARLAHASAELRIIPLLFGELQIPDVTVEGLDLLLETNAQGRGNWVFDREKALPETKIEKEAETPQGSEEQKQVKLPTLQSVSFKDVTITYQDGKTGKQTKVHVDALALAADTENDPIEIDLAATFQNAPITAKATLGSFQSLTRGEAPYPVAADIDFLGADLAIDGAIAEPLKGRGADVEISMTAERLSEIADFIGAAPPAASRASFKGRFHQEKDTYFLENIDAQVGRSDLSGDLRVTLAGIRPRLTGALHSSIVDMAELLPKAKQGPRREMKETENKKNDGGRLIPDTPLPYDALKAFDADVTAQFETIIPPSGQRIQDVVVSANNTDGRLKVQANIGNFMNGTLQSKIAADAQGQKLSSAVNFAGVEPGAILDSYGFAGTVEGGTVAGDLDFSGKGGSVRQLFARANGKILIEAAEARVENASITFAGAQLLKQLTEAINPFASSDRISLVECVVVNATIRDGIADIDPGIAIETDKMNVSGLGTINLRNEQVDLAMRAAGAEGEGAGVVGAASSFVQVRGTLAQPSVSVDPLSALDGVARRSGGDVLSGILSGEPKDILELFANADPTPCRTALGQKPATSAQPTPQRDKDAEDVLKNVEKGLKGLFGR